MFHDYGGSGECRLRSVNNFCGKIMLDNSRLQELLQEYEGLYGIGSSGEFRLDSAEPDGMSPLAYLVQQCSGTVALHVPIGGWAYIRRIFGVENEENWFGSIAEPRLVQFNEGHAWCLNKGGQDDTWYKLDNQSGRPQRLRTISMTQSTGYVIALDYNSVIRYILPKLEQEIHRYLVTQQLDKFDETNVDLWIQCMIERGLLLHDLQLPLMYYLRLHTTVVHDSSFREIYKSLRSEFGINANTATFIRDRIFPTLKHICKH